MIKLTSSFKENLQLLPSVQGVTRIEILNEAGTVVDAIENAPGKQGSLAVYRYLEQCFGSLDSNAAVHGLAVFAEHTVDAKNRPGAHPNIDRLLEIVEGGAVLNVRVFEA